MNLANNDKNFSWAPNSYNKQILFIRQDSSKCIQKTKQIQAENGSVTPLFSSRRNTEMLTVIDNEEDKVYTC